MGYLLDNIFLQKTFTIPQINVSSLGSTGFKIVDVGSNEIQVIYHFSIQVINSTSEYLGFSNIFISNRVSGAGGKVYGYSDLTTDALNSAYLLDLSINSFDYLNNRRGNSYKYGTDLFLRFTNNPSAGNGDFLCTMIYKQFTSI